MYSSHVFPQAVLAAITLVGDGAGDEGARAGTGCDAGLSLCSVAIAAISGVCLIPSCWIRSPDGWAWVGSVPFKCVPFPLPAPESLPQRERVLKQGGPMWAVCLRWP